MSTLLAANGTVQVAVASGESIAIFSEGRASVARLVGYPNYPDQLTPVGSVSGGQVVFGPYASGATIVIDASGGADVYYETGNAPVVKQNKRPASTLSVVNAVNATGSIPMSYMLGGTITSTTAAAVSATLPSGGGAELATNFAIGESFDWSVINTGATNAFTVLQGASGHTVVGNMAVAASTSGLFRTRKSAVDTFVTYRIS